MPQDDRCADDHFHNFRVEAWAPVSECICDLGQRLLLQLGEIGAATGRDTLRPVCIQALILLGSLLVNWVQRCCSQAERLTPFGFDRPSLTAVGAKLLRTDYPASATVEVRTGGEAFDHNSFVGPQHRHRRLGGKPRCFTWPST
eukprot:6328318-Prymnesium_polylepis.2